MSELVLEKNELLPNGWITCTIGDLFNVSYGLSERLSKTSPTSKNDIPVIRIPNITDGGILDLSKLKYFTLDEKKKSRLMLKKGDVLFNWRNAPKWIGRSAVFDNEEEYVNASFLLKLRPYKKGYSYFISYYLNFLRKTGFFLNIIENAVNQANFNGSKTKQIQIILPPLNEQKRIVSKIQELFSKIESTTELLENVKLRLSEYKHSLLIWIFYGDFKQKFSFSSDWKKVSLVDVYDIVGGGTPSTKNPKYWNGKTPWITSADIYGIKDIRPRRNVSQLGIENSATNVIPKNSILVVTRVGLGKLGITEKPMCINQDIQALIERDSQIYSLFALHYLSEEVQIFKYRNRGTTISGVTKKQLADLSFILPSLEDQKRIVDYIEMQVSKIQNTKKTVEENLLILNSMKALILKQAFEGKLVPQDPNDEPAEILLQKIKQEKEQLLQKQKPSRRKKNGK